MSEFPSPGDEWRAYLSGTHPNFLRRRRGYRFVPSNPRCRLCAAPFRGPGGLLFRRYGFEPWEKNPKICKRCIVGLENESERLSKEAGGPHVAGAEIDASFLFADVRRSSELARQIGTMEFTRLMQRFYAVASEVIIDNDGILDKFVGDEAVGFFLPFMTEGSHSARAIRTAQELLRATGHGSEEGPWVTIGAGVHTGEAFVGVVPRGGASEFTALGDPVNIAAHLAAQARAGEILVTTRAAAAAELDVAGLEQRSLSLKGHPVQAFSMSITGSPATSAEEPAVG